MAANASAKRCARRLVDALDRFARLGDRVDEVLALRREERVPRLELVELLDGHHVHRTEAVDLARAARAIASSALSVRCCASMTAAPGSVRSALARRRPRLGRCRRRRRRRMPCGQRFAVLGRLVRSSAQSAAASGTSPPAASSAATSTITSSSVAWTASTHVCARCARSLSAVARATSSSATVPRIASSAPRAVRMAARATRSCARSVAAPVVGRLQLVAQRRRASGRRRRARCSPVDDGGAQLVDATSACARRSAASAVARSSSSARRLFQPQHFGRQRRRALDEAGVRGLGLGGALAQLLRRLARLEQAPLRSGEPLVGLALLAFELDDRRARLLLTPVEQIALFLELAALARELLARCARRRCPRRPRAAAALRSRRSPSRAGGARRAAPRSRDAPARSPARTPRPRR